LITIVTMYFCAKLIAGGCIPGSVDFKAPATEDCEQALIFTAKQAADWQREHPEQALEGGASCQWVADENKPDG
jgi:hypothetical protein